MAAEATVAEDTAAADAARVDLLVEEFKVAITPAEIERVKSLTPPMNILFEMGNERSEKNVNVVHIKQYADVLTEVGRKFHNTNIAVPCKVIARQALIKFDTAHEGKLSHARTLKFKGQIVLKRTDQNQWAKKNGDTLGKLITWFKKLRKSSKSHDPVIAHIKSFGYSMSQTTRT